MFTKHLKKKIFLLMTVFGLSACSSQQKEPVVITQYEFDTPESTVKKYFDDQFVIYKEIFSDFEVFRVSEREIKIVLPSAYGFVTGKSNMTRTLKNSVSDLAVVLKQYKESSIWIYGHTDNIGTKKYNVKLAMDRAGRVESVLLDNHMNPDRIKKIAEAFEVPKCSNQTKNGKECNRRVELVIKDSTII